MRSKSAQATEGNGCSGWPTPAAHEARLGFQNRNNGKKGSQKSLTTIVVEVGQQDQAKANTNGRNRERWPTVCAGDYRTPPTNSGVKGQKVMPASEHGLPKKAGGKLNPNWVEQLMGLDVGRTQLPTEWTDCDYSATESCRKQQQRHG